MKTLFGLKGLCFCAHRLLQAGYRGHVEAGDDRHQGIKVADVEAFSGGLDPVLDDANALLFLRVLRKREKKILDYTRYILVKSETY